LRRYNLEQECPTKGLDTQAARAWVLNVKLEPLDRLELDQLLAQWRLWDEQLAQLDQRIRERVGEHPQAQAIGTILGRPGYCSLALACRVGPIEHFVRPRSLANYWGLAPGCRNSGETTDRLGSITKQGSAVARAVLGQMVLHVLRRDAWLRAWYQRIKRRRGSKIARVAVMRRLATIIWHLLRHGEPYTPGGPPRRRLTRRAVATTIT
jgi:transposase